MYILSLKLSQINFKKLIIIICFGMGKYVFKDWNLEAILHFNYKNQTTLPFSIPLPPPHLLPAKSKYNCLLISYSSHGQIMVAQNNDNSMDLGCPPWEWKVQNVKNFEPLQTISVVVQGSSARITTNCHQGNF